MLRSGKEDRPRLRTIAAIGLVFVVTFVCFLPSLQNGLLAWDDAGYILENEHIRSLSLETVRWAFFEFHCNYWAPLTWLSLALDYAVWGLNPLGYHLTNNVLHAANAGLYFLVSLRLLRYHRSTAGGEARASPGTADRAFAGALVASLFFAVHALRVESVAWATERKDVLSLFFGLSAVLAYLEHARSDAERGGTSPEARIAGTPAYQLALTLYALSLLSKSILVTLPAVLLVLDWFPLRRLRAGVWRRLLLEKAPFLLLATVVSAITASAHTPQMKSLADVDVRTRVILAFESLVAYLRLTALPLDVSPAYLHPGSITEITVWHLLPVIAILAITAACAATARRRPLFAAAWAVYLVTLSPVLGLLQNGPQSMAARFTYVPATALSLLVGLGAVALYGRAGRSPGARGIVAGATVAVLLGNVVLTVRDLSYWRDDIALWTRSIELQPHAVGRAYFNRALIYQMRGEYHRALTDFDEAYAIALRKGYRGAHEIIAARARVFRDMGDLEGAIAEFGRAIRSAGAREGRMYLWERGSIHRARGSAELAADDFRHSAMMQ